MVPRNFIEEGHILIKDILTQAGCNLAIQGILMRAVQKVAIQVACMLVITADNKVVSSTEGA